MICTIRQEMSLSQFGERLSYEGNEYYEKNFYQVPLVSITDAGSLKESVKFKCGRHDRKSDILEILGHLSEVFVKVQDYMSGLESSENVFAWLTCGGNLNVAYWKDGKLEELVAGRRHGVNFLAADYDSAEVEYIQSQRTDLPPWKTSTR